GEAFPCSEIRVISVNDSAIPVHAASFGRLYFIGCGPRESWFLKVRVVLTALRETLRHPPNVIICGHINLALLALLLSAVSRGRIALVAHGFEAWAPRANLRLAARCIHQVFPVSRFTANRIEEWGIKHDRIRIVSDTVDGEVFRPIRREKPPKGKVLLTVARLDASERAKGVDLVIKALRSVRVHHPSVQYVVAGKGDDVPRLQSLARELGVANSVKFLGYVPDKELPALYSEADLFVMPSWKEGFGIVFLEALACGVPVVAGNRDGSVDAVLDGQIGLLVDPEDSAQLVQGILGFLNGTQIKTLRDPMHLRRKVLSYYGFDRFRESVRAVLMNEQPGILS
ncbi:MAG: glycosyltransferase family 4 protein, partial [Terriglobia bacterium]